MREGRTPLYIAADNGHEAVVRVLIQAGSEVNKIVEMRPQYTKTLLCIAAERSREAVVRALIEADVDVNKATDTSAAPPSYTKLNGANGVTPCSALL